ncbi:hypothetical protein CANCADRAFT_30623 [Tortispora caseinolytica NRRL Y-17796]|uniref:Aldose 1-epimerase n=1 Tax=Tortispora caseinolytica NRRL Y-17796 TaxID=767744 RepID=A0A1E4TL56_9ASCO|nr:hypothetical protein CANCADRAFT_30623 [Tortispora caseinolytica NRRL Y-17796]
MSVRYSKIGATITELTPPGGNNVVLNYSNDEEYRKQDCYIGVTAGRVANRIGKARFVLDDKEWKVVANEGQNMLHGGNGWHNIDWDRIDISDNICEFKLWSPHLDSGFPGSVEVTTKYESVVEDDVLKVTIEYTGRLTDDSLAKATIINLTNHSYYNPNGAGDISDVKMHIGSNRILEVDSESIPTGKIVPCTLAPESMYKELTTIGEVSLDNTFVFEETCKLDTRDEELRLCCELYSPRAGTHIAVYSTEPAFQVYTGDGLNGVYKARNGICIEPMRFTDAISFDKWKDQVILRSGQIYGSKIVIKTWKDKN